MPGAFAQLARYGLVGLAVNATGYLLYLLATWLGAGPKSTMTVLYVVGACAGYLGHRRWSFRYRGAVTSSFAKFVLIQLTGYALNFLLLAQFADRLGYPHQWVQGIAIFVVALYLFVAFRLFAFAPRALPFHERKE